MERSKKDWMKTVGKQRDGRDKASPFAYLKFSPMNYISISIFTLCFIRISSITMWICLTKIYKVTIACFIPTISVGSTLTRVRFITWTTQCTCWLVVRSCVMPWYWTPSSLGFMTGDYESCEKYCSQFRAPCSQEDAQLTSWAEHWGLMCICLVPCQASGECSAHRLSWALVPWCQFGARPVLLARAEMLLWCTKYNALLTKWAEHWLFQGKFLGSKPMGSMRWSFSLVFLWCLASLLPQGVGFEPWGMYFGHFWLIFLVSSASDAFTYLLF